ncbi:MAG: ABC transporter permease [Solirubrobacteraceae bacterium]|jgi:peptide/nickel transport system permease protein
MRFIARRLGFYVIAGWFALTLNFLIPRALPGNAVESMMAKYPNLPPSAIAVLDKDFGVTCHAHLVDGLRQLSCSNGGQGSLLQQYFVYLGHMLHLNFGLSVDFYPTTVASTLHTTLPWTLGLVGTATILSFIIGTGLGILAGWRRGGRFDQAMPGFSFLQAMPYFFLAELLLLLLANTWHLFPASGGSTLGTTAGFNWPFINSVLDHSVLPAFTIIITSMAGWMLQMRNVMITTIGEDYVLAAQAKGLSTRRIMFTYAARNAILPNIAGFALAIGFVVAGAIVMEIVFSYPGVGYQVLAAVTSDDIPTMQGIFLAISFAVLLACLLADVVYVIADPRTRTRAAY